MAILESILKDGLGSDWVKEESACAWAWKAGLLEDCEELVRQKSECVCGDEEEEKAKVEDGRGGFYTRT